MWECRPSSRRPGAVVHAAYGLERVAAGDREAELLVLVGGGDVLVRVGLDAGGDPHHHAHRPAELGGDVGEPPDLVEGVHDDPAHAELDGALELAEGLVVAVEADALHREPGPLRDGQLAARADVEREPLLREPPGDGGAEERLAARRRRSTVVGERRRHGRRRRGCGSRPRRGRTPVSRARAPARAAARRRRSGRRRTSSPSATRGAGRARRGRSAHAASAGPRSAPSAWAQPDGCAVGTPDHILSGAETPSRSRPLASTVRTDCDEHEARLVGRRDGLVAQRQHPALLGVVPPVEHRSGVLEVAGDTVRLAELGGGRRRPAGTPPARAAARPSSSWVSSEGSKSAPGDTMPRSAAFSIIRQERACAYWT